MHRVLHEAQEPAVGRVSVCKARVRRPRHRPSPSSASPPRRIGCRAPSAFSLTGLHFRDHPVVEGDAADELDIGMQPYQVEPHLGDGWKSRTSHQRREAEWGAGAETGRRIKPGITPASPNSLVRLDHESRLLAAEALGFLRWPHRTEPTTMGSEYECRKWIAASGKPVD
jgi:hypothetical protein